MRAERIAGALNGRRTRSGWIACCPAHDDQKPSLSIREVDGKILVHCHVGCGNTEVIGVLKKRGLWDHEPTSRFRVRHRHKVSMVAPDQGCAERTARAFSIWDSATAIDGTRAETYLNSRGLTLPRPSSLRFHRGLMHPSGGIWPCMVARVTTGVDNVPVAIHRTFLARDG